MFEPAMPHSATATPTTDTLTEQDAAARLGLKVATLRAWRHQGQGPAYVRLGRAVRYLASDILQFLQTNRRHPADGRENPVS